MGCKEVGWRGGRRGKKVDGRVGGNWWRRMGRKLWLNPRDVKGNAHHMISSRVRTHQVMHITAKECTCTCLVYVKQGN